MKKFVIGLVLVMSVFIVGAIYIYQQSHAPYASAKQETVAFITERTDLTEAEAFYWYNGEESYFTVQGLTESGDEMIYIVKQDGGQILSLAVKDTISKAEAIKQAKDSRSPAKILDATIGIMDGTPIWEVSYRNENDRLGYYVIDLQTGEWIRTIDNI